MKRIIISLFIIHYSFFTIHSSEAQIIHVPADQPTIQAGIDAASDGDTILVAGGTYFENINFMGKAITVASHFLVDADTNHINNTIIDGSQPSNPDFGSVITLMTGEDTTSVICGFTITGGSGMKEPVTGGKMGGGIVCYFATAKIDHNIITGNTVTKPSGAWGGGIECYRETGNDWIIISNSKISENQCVTISGFCTGGGIEIYGNARICNNTIGNNSCASALGIATGGGVYSQSLNEPLDTLYLCNNIIQHNTVDAHEWGEGGGVYTLYSYTVASNNTIKYNTVTSPNGAYGGGVGLDYAYAFFTGNEISFNSSSGLAVQGGGVYLILNVIAEFTDNQISHNAGSGYTVEGGGVYSGLTENALFTNNEIVYNSCITDNAWYGAGVSCYGPGGPLKFIGNDFAYNNGPVQPVGGGGGLWIQDALDILITIDGNRFRNNEAYNGGGFFEKSCYNVNLTNNIFSGNHANIAAGAAFYHPNLKAAETIMENKVSEVRIYNNTFKSNTADTKGGAIRFQGDLNIPKILNCIFWLNSTPSIVNDGIGVLDISFSDFNPGDITGTWNGEENIDLDPFFMTLDPFYHLSSVSPCINTGTQNMSTPTHDFDGEDRPDPVNGLTDMGADEFWDVPEAPDALDPDTIGDDYFVARWHRSIPLALGYELDVAYDMNFEEFVPGYENLDVGEDTSKMVINPAGLDCYYRVRAYNALWISPNSDTIVVIWNGVETPFVPNFRFQVQIYPNPTAGNVQFAVRSWQEEYVTLKIFDLQGREVTTVLNQKLPAGEYSVQWNADKMPNGIYLYRLTTSDHRPQTLYGKIVVNH